MAVTESTYTGNGSTTNYSFTFPYLKTTDIKASINGTATTAFTLANATTVQFNTAPANSAAIRIYRETDDSKLEATFFAGSAIKSSDLNDNFNQNLYVTQESNNKIDAAWTTGDETITSGETWVSNDSRVSTTAAQDARIDSKIDTALTTDVAAGNKITVTDNSPGSGQITVGVTSGSLVNSDVNASAAIAGTKISPDFGSQNIATTGTVDGRDVSVDGTKLDGIETGATADQTNAEIRAAVEAATDSNVFTDADHSKLNAIEPSATADQTDAEIRAAVANASDSNVFTDADHTKLNAIEASATADQTDAEIRAAVEAATDSNVFTDADHSKLNAIEASATADQTASEIKTLLQSDKITDSEIETGTLDGRYYTKTTSDARYFNISTGDTIKDGDAFPDNDTTIATTAAINDRIIDLVDDVGGFVPIANETSFPNANPDVNNGTGTLVSIKTLASNLTSNGSGVATVANGTVGNSTVTITGLENSTTYSSGYGMIVETTTTLNTYTFHRLVPKATEVTTVAGKATEIGRLGTAAAVEDLGILGTAAVVADLAILGTNDVVSDLNTLATADVVSDMNTLAVTSVVNNMDTCATNVSNINTVGGAISNVNTVATNISNVNDFSDKYRVASSAPSSNNDAGDLYFDTTSNELRVYNGSAWQGGVTATGNLASLGANTFTGAQTFVSSQTFDGRDVSVDGAKLDGIEAGATADQTNAEIRAAVEAASDSNVFTDADHTKLNAIEAGATGDQTNAEIRAAVEAASDSHVFTDADHTKLNAIEAGATADQTKSEIEALNIAAASCTGNAATATNANAADTVDITNNQINATYYPTFVDNNGSGKTLYMDQSGQLNYNPYTNNLVAGTFSGSGAGLSNVNATTLDSIDSGSFLRSDTSDAFTSGSLQIHGLSFEASGIAHNLKIKRPTSGSDLGLTFYDGSNNWRMQLYATQGHYGFLDANWGSWDIRKAPSGAFMVDEGSGLQRVLNAGNVGSGGALSGTEVNANSARLTDTSSPLHLYGWQYFDSTTDGLYWNGGSAAGMHIHPNDNANMKLRSGSNSNVSWMMQTNGVTRGYFYADSGSYIGILNNAGSWIFRGKSDLSVELFNDLYPYTNNNFKLGSSSRKWSHVYATEFHGDGSNLTGISSAPEHAMTASGSVTQGKPLVVNASGQVEALSETVTPLSSFSEHKNNFNVGSSMNAYEWTGVWEPVSGMLVVGGHRDYGGRDRFHIRVLKITDQNTISNPTSSEATEQPSTKNMWLPNNSSSYGTETLSHYGVMAHNGQGTIVAAFQYKTDDVNSYPKLMGACAFNITKDSKSGYPTYGSIVNANSSTFSNDNHRPKIVYCGSNRFVVTWANNTYSGGSWGTYSAVVTLSGTNTLTWGPTTDAGCQVQQTKDICWDSTNNKVVFIYGSKDSIGRQWLNCKTATISGTGSSATLSWSSEVTLSDTYYNEPRRCRVDHDSTTGKNVAAWIRLNRQPRCRVINASGSTPTLGTETTIQSSTAYSNTKMGVVFDTLGEKMHILYQDYQNHCALFIATTYSNNNNISLSSKTNIDSGGNNNYPEWMVPIPAFAMMFVLNHSSGSYPRGDMYKTATRESNIDDHPVIGFAKNSASNGGSVTVQLNGSVQENQSGLTPGKHYYPTADGGVSLSEPTFYGVTTKAGVALSATKLAINISY